MNRNRQSQDRVSEAQIEALLRHVGPRPQPPEGAADVVHDTVRQAWRESVSARRRQRRRWVGLAAAASVILAFATGLVLTQGPASPTPVAHFAHSVNSLEYKKAGSGHWVSPPADGVLANGDELRLGDDSYATLTLPDGVSLRLDATTEVQLRGENQVYLRRGALYADAEGAGSVTVATDRGTARDIGTRFEVRVTEAGWQVQVRDGRVIVDDRQAGRATAAAGERLLADSDEFSREQVGPADASWAWTRAATQPLEVEGNTLSAYLHWWSEESGVQVRFETPIDEAIAAQTRLHGNLDGLTFEEGFQAILAGAGYRVLDRDGQQVMLAR